MYCLLEYPRDKSPIENQTLIRRLWSSTTAKHGLFYTRHLLEKTLRPSDRLDLWCDIECRRRHLVNLIATLERFSRWTQTHEVMTEAHIMAEKLLELIHRLDEDSPNTLTSCQDAYRKMISLSTSDEGLGLLYIRVCERLLADICEAEFCRAFSATHAKMIEWSCALCSSNQFQPKVQDLLTTIESDLIDQWGHHRHGVIRAKIGIVGYTCVGKSTILNRILGVHNLANADSSPVRSIKSTYYPLQFDRKEPLISFNNKSKKVLVTLVDIQGHDKNTPIVDRTIEPGNYLDEIRKADCDIYILVFDETLRYEQHGWITYIEQTLKRQCLLVRSKVDIDFLAKFRERSGICFGASTPEQRLELTPNILEQLRFDNQVDGYHVYLIAADYMPASSDAEILLRDQPFDMSLLVDELLLQAAQARNHRIHALAMRAVARVVNICFRRGYVLNVLNYKIGAGFAAVVPFGDQLPRYLARDHIRQAFGITEDFRNYLLRFHLIVDDGCLQTSSLESCVTATMMKSKMNRASVGTVVGNAFIAGAPFSDDIFRGFLAPTTVLLTGPARIMLTASVSAVGVIVTAAVCAFSAVDSGKHIFGYVNRLCDDLILVSSPLIDSMIELNANKYEPAS